MISIVKDLKEILNKVDENLQVVIETDHGQTPTNIFWAGKAKWEIKEEFVLHPDDYDDFPNSVDILFIQGA